MDGRGRAVRTAGAVLLSCVVLAGTAGTSSAVPPPPPNPSDSELHSESGEAREAARRVGVLTSRVAAAKGALTSAQVDLATKYGEVTTAQARARAAGEAAELARAEARGARLSKDAAGKDLQRLKRDVDAFAGASYRQGTVPGSSLSLYLTANSPKDVLDRQSLLAAAADSQLNALENMRSARVEKSNLDAAARAAVAEAERKRREAAAARRVARASYTAAVDAKRDAARQASRLLKREREAERQLADARHTLADLRAQRARYDDWRAAREAERRAKANRIRPHSHPEPSTSAVRNRTGVVAPVRGVITSTYGPRWGTIHYGLDIANSIGTPIVSAMDGRVISSGPASGFGLWVRVQDDNGMITVYGHLNETLVSVGEPVRAGQQIATVGNRGQSTGPHLHFEVHQQGVPIDPLFWLRRSGVSI